MFHYNKDLAFIIDKDKHCIIDHIIYDALFGDFTKYGEQLNPYKEKLKIEIYDHIIDTHGFDFFIEHFPNLFSKLFYNYNGRNFNFAQHILNKDINKNNVKFNTLIRYQYNDKSQTPIMSLRAQRLPIKNQFNFFIKKIIELYPLVLEDGSYGVFHGKYIKAYHIFEYIRDNEIIKFIDTFVKINKLELNYK